MRMNKLFLALNAVVLGALAQPYPPDTANAAAPRSRPARLEGMYYLPARRIILSYGWRPATGPCQLVTASECASFPEIQACSCCGLAPCGMVFQRGNRCLYLGTEGGEPVPGEEEGDTRVTGVAYRRAPCVRP